MTSPESASNLPRGLYFDEQKGIVVEGIVARQLATHPVGMRPNRAGKTCTFNDLAGNTALTMYLAELEPGDHKCAHRHFDETLAYVVSGSGYSEFRQEDSRPLSRIEWQAGDVFATPMNAWHEHVNTSDSDRARILSFKNAPAVHRLIGHGEGVDTSNWRLRDRYDDEPDYFTTMTRRDDGSISAGHVRQIASHALPDDDRELGSGVAQLTFVLGGQRMLHSSLIAVRSGGTMGPHRPLAEEALVVLAGSGETDIWTNDGRARTVEWCEGDLVSPPFDVWRQHRTDTSTDVRFLQVRNAFPTTGLGESAERRGRPADRFPAVIEAREWSSNSGP